MRNRDKCRAVYAMAMFAVAASIHFGSAPFSALSGIVFGFLTCLMLFWDELCEVGRSR
jgi:hypothetical protein